MRLQIYKRIIEFNRRYTFTPTFVISVPMIKMKRLKKEKISTGHELKIAVGKQRIYVTLELSSLTKSPKAHPNFSHTPFYTINSKAITGLKSIDMITRRGIALHPNQGFIFIRHNNPHFWHFKVKKFICVQTEIYQGISRHEEWHAITSLSHSLNLPAFADKFILKTLLNYQPDLRAHRGDQKAILSYDIDTASTPSPQNIPNYKEGNFKKISKIYKDVQPLHLHLFDPPKLPVPPEERNMKNHPGFRWYLDYPLQSYVITW